VADLPSKTVTVLTAAKITELTTKFPNLGIETFVHERDYNQMANGREELRQCFEHACARITELESAGETPCDVCGGTQFVPVTVAPCEACYQRRVRASEKTT
jgi:hypothetical protein